MEKVTSGWKGSREINTVVFDPGVIAPEEMVEVLKKAGTYRDTVKQ